MTTKTKPRNTVVGVYLDDMIQDAVLHIDAMQRLTAMIKAGIHHKRSDLLGYYAQFEAVTDENTVVIGELTLYRQEIEESLKTVSTNLLEALNELKRLEKEARIKEFT